MPENCLPLDKKVQNGIPQETVAGIPQETVQDTMRNFRERRQACARCGGGHLKNIIFKTLF